MFLRCKHGAIIESNISVSSDTTTASEQAESVHELLKGQLLHEISISRWKQILQNSLGQTHAVNSPLAQDLGEYVGGLLGGQ